MNKNRIEMQRDIRLNPPGRGETDLLSSDEAKIRFNDLLVESFLECVEFGEVMLRFLELNAPLNRNEIADKPELFAKELESLLGEGAKMIEEKIIRTLYEKIGKKYIMRKGSSFSDYVRAAQRIYLKSCESTRPDRSPPISPKGRNQ